MGLYFPLFNFTIIFTRTVLINERTKNKLNHFKIVLSHVGSVTERSGAPFYSDINEAKGRGSTPTFDKLLCSWIRKPTSRYLSLLGGLNKQQIQQKTRRGTSEKLTPKRVRISNLTYRDTTRFLVNGG